MIHRRNEIILITLISFAIAIASLFQTIVYVLKTPSGFVYPLVHNFEADYYWYLSLMRQGWEGNMLITSRLTPEYFPSQFVNTFFPLAGFIARIFGLSLPFMYTILRVAGGAALLAAAYMLFREIGITRHQRILAYFFMIIGAPLWFFENGMLRQAGEFWTGFDPILRVTWLPHHTFANACMIVSLIMFGRLFQNKSLKGLMFLKDAVLAGILAAVSGWLNPASLLVLLVTVSFGCAIYGVQHIKAFVENLGKKGIYRIIAGLTVFYLCAGIPALFLYRVQNSVFPWTAFRDWEQFVQYPIDAWGYLAVLGFVGIVGTVSIPLAMVKRDIIWNFMVSWFAIPFIGLAVLSRFLPISNGRYLQAAGYIPAAILASEGIFFTTRLVKNRVYKKTILICVLLVMTFINIPSFIASIERLLIYVGRNMSNPLVMISRDSWDAISCLGKQKVQGVIIAPGDISTMIPAFTSLRVVAGHPTFTYQAGLKEVDLGRFYTTPDGRQISDIITKYNARSVWVPQWMTNPQLIEAAGFAKLYENKTVKIYGKL